MKLTILYGNALEFLPKLPDNSIDLVLTSPPYWALRDYGIAGQLGMETTLEEYIQNTLRWVREVYRILKPSGNFILNIGDCWAGSGKGGTSISAINPNRRESQPHNFRWVSGKEYSLPSGKIKGKHLVSVSSFLYCRISSDTEFTCRGEHIICKPNMPSPIRSRLKHSHEKIFWFIKNANRYYFDKRAWMKKVKAATVQRVNYAANYSKNTQGARSRLLEKGWCGEETIEHSWRVVPVGEKQKGFEMEEKKPMQEHIAPFSMYLIEPYIKSMCPPDGTVLDPFLGSGTTMRVAMENNRNCIGIELNEKYIDYAKKRLNWGYGLNIDYMEKLED